MQIHGAYTRGIQGHLFTVSAAPNRAGRLHVAGVRDTVAQHTATTVTHALKRLGIGEVGADVRLEPAGAGDPPLATGRYSGTLDLPIALALLAVAGRLPADRLAGIVAVGGLDPYAAIESAGVRCIGAGGTTAIAHAVQARGLRLIVAEDRAAAACAECRETTGAMTLEELVTVLADYRDDEPLPHRTAAGKRRDPGTWRLSEGDLRALEIACAGWHNIHVIGPEGHSLPQYGRIAQALLPDLDGEAACETSKIHGVAGLMAPWTARIAEPPLRIPHYTASRGAVAGSRGRPGEVNLAHNGVLVIDQPTEFDRDATDALVAVAEDGQTVIYRYAPVDHTIRMPARFRLTVTTRPDEIETRRHRAANLLDLCDIEVTGGMPTDTAMPPERLQAGRERIARAASILEGTPPHLLAGRGPTTRRAGAPGPWPRPSQRSTAAGNSRTRTSPKPPGFSSAAIADDRPPRTPNPDTPGPPAPAREPRQARTRARRRRAPRMGRPRPVQVRDVRVLVRDLGPPQPPLRNPETQPLEKPRGRRPAAPDNVVTSAPQRR